MTQDAKFHRENSPSLREAANGKFRALPLRTRPKSIYRHRVMKLVPILILSSLGLFRASCEKKGDNEVTKEQVEISLEGVDTSALTPRERREWSGHVVKLVPPCSNAGASVASCITEKKTCAACLPAAKHVLKSVRDGLTDEQIDKSYKNRFDPSKVKDVRLEDSPSKGVSNAALTVVEFADFECPHCAQMMPIMEKAFQAYAGNANFSYKFLPMPMHMHGEISSRAGFAASRQGKFWEMSEKMFKNQAHLEETNLLDYAKELGLDVQKFKADMVGSEATSRLAKDKKLADDLDVKGTPTIYINGRLFEAGANPEQVMMDWLALDLTLSGVEKKAAPPALSVMPGLAASAKDAGVLLLDAGIKGPRK
jgi:protein-disulfide isomerase